MQKVLVANRGEIANRVIRATKDAGLKSVAVYADPDANSLFVQRADEAFALGGATPKDSYLDGDKIIKAALQAGADAVHPGYGFLAENADFAQACIDAGLTWIGPPPEAIRNLGDKVKARHIAMKVGAPLVPGTADPIENADAAVAFAEEFGLPIAIKAAFGGGGRGIRVARTLEEIPKQFEAAVSEATVAFGRGECFVERFLDRPRHVETQCLADAHGNVVVVSTRDCSLQRRNQKLVEEAPAPFLTSEQRDALYSSSKAILKEAGYVGAGTCEFLLGEDGLLSFLEVNTRLQVEHPVSEEVTGLDLVREMFRIADGQELGYSDPEIRGHSIEFRLNAEDAGRKFMPSPGTLEGWRLPTGPGVRVDEGYRTGMVIPGQFDSLVAKIIVTGDCRTQAIERARRALSETRIDGMPSVLPFHRALLEEPDFLAEDGNFRVHTKWIETDFDNQIPPYDGIARTSEPEQLATFFIEVNGKRVELRVPTSFSLGAPKPEPPKPVEQRTEPVEVPALDFSTAITAPLHGKIQKILEGEGRYVNEGDHVVIMEALKMRLPLAAHRSGKIVNMQVSEGEAVSTGQTICNIVD
ncbi:MAG: ATP-grasp domain-containing protein [Propionibacteriaceae bacterium]|jgi:acetyl-CoA/propionyl-CoA carboxylase biotin carboxyl carrier protein|nr:ATP-grasp domain-containing protein [Propionibacteriaceae bacterium]